MVDCLGLTEPIGGRIAIMMLIELKFQLLECPDRFRFVDPWYGLNLNLYGIVELVEMGSLPLGLTGEILGVILKSAEIIGEILDLAF